MQLSELDLFKAASEDPVVIKSGLSVQKTMYKVWSGLTKFIRSSLSQEKSVFCAEFGKFYPTNPCRFVPSPSFLSFTKVFYKSSTEVPLISVKEQVVSYSSIAEVCGIDRELVQQSFKETLHQLSKKIQTGATVVLHFKVGDLTVTKQWADFGAASYLEKPTNSVCVSVSTPRSSRFTVVSDSTSVHASNPNPLHQGPSLNLNNYYRGIKYKNDNSLLAPVAFYTGQIHPVFNFRTKFTRKQACEQPLSPQDLLKIHLEQIDMKKNKEKNERDKEKHENYKTLQGVFEMIKSEKSQKVKNEIEKRKNLAYANLEQVKSKHLRKYSENEAKKNEVYDYFPFTHGDNVEENQKNLNLKLKEEMKNYFKSVENSPMNTSREMVVGVPKFLQADEYNNIRRTQNEHVEKVMKNALDSYHQDLKTKEKKQIIEQREKEQQDLIDEMYYRQLELNRKKEIEDNLLAVQDQIKQKEKNKKEETEKNKKLYQTSLNFMNASPEKIKEQKEFYLEHNQHVIEQMIENEKRNKEMMTKEREIDGKIIESMDNYLANEENEAKLTDTYTKTLNKGIWLKQMEIRALEKDVGKIL